MSSSSKASNTALPETIILPRDKGLHLDLKEIWQYRELGFFLIWRTFKVRYRQTLLGVAWGFLQPLATAFTLLLVRSIVDIPTDGLHPAVFYLAGIVPWTFFVQGVQGATGSLVEHQSVITKVYFPRIILPLSGAVAGAVDFVFGMVVLIVAMLIFDSSFGNLWGLPLFLLYAWVISIAIGMWLSSLNAIYRDIRYGLTFLLGLWMFATPIVYPLTAVSRSWRFLYDLNPLVLVIQGFRWSLTGHGVLPGTSAWISAASILVILLTGIWFFQRAEATIVDVV
ncbi:MAG TPA: ABC transporter permease [Actinomycetota bacterium]|nr:ABC transporter permease [Actinomycetota bacterium]